MLTSNWLRSIVLNPKTALTGQDHSFFFPKLKRPFKSSFGLYKIWSVKKSSVPGRSGCSSEHHGMQKNILSKMPSILSAAIDSVAEPFKSSSSAELIISLNQREVHNIELTYGSRNCSNKYSSRPFSTVRLIYYLSYSCN